MSMIRLLSIIVLSAVLLVGCGQSTLSAAPLGDQAALEKLAEAYKSALETVPSAPRSMRPKGRKAFVEQVFQDAGYDYAATLAALAQGLDAKNTSHRDLAQLASLPFSNMSDAAMDEILSGDTLDNARLLRKRMK